MNKLIRIESNQPVNLLKVELFLSDICNYNCWYCFPGSKEGIQPWPKLESIIDNLSYLLDYYKEKLGKTEFSLHIVGGEPTLWRDFGEFTKYFKDNYQCLISMSSNGSRTLRWWDEYGHYFDHVMLSCHHETIDPKHLVQVADILYEKKVWANCLVLMDPHYWDKCVDIIEQLKLSKHLFCINANEVLHNTVNYTREQQIFLSNSIKRLPDASYYYGSNKIPKIDPTVYYNDGSMETVNHNWLSLNNHTNFMGWDCSLGLETIAINKNGDITGSCTEYLYNMSYKYNIYDKDFISKFNPVLTSTTCNQISCHCAPEQRVTKQYKVTEQRVIPIVKL